MSHFKRKVLHSVNMFWMILIVTQVPQSQKGLAFNFRNGCHVFSFVIIAAFKSKQSLFFIGVFWQL